MNDRLRRGSVLIIVVGLASVLLAVFAVLVRQIRTDAGAASDVLADAQARLMLHSAMCFVMEHSRLGFHVDGETYGWTDVRTGAVGPLRRTDSSLVRDPANGNLGAGNAWPAPGSVYRADMTPWSRPPAATLPLAAPNPVAFPAAWLEEYESATDPAGTTLAGVVGPTQSGNGTEFGTVDDQNKFTHWSGYGDINDDASLLRLKALNGSGLRYHWNRVWDHLLEPMGQEAPGYHGNIDVQPVADDFTAFASGDPTPRALAGAQSWFRIYREEASDHDGDGSPFYDQMTLSGHGVFIVTCGAGGSRGFRDWAEVGDAGATDLFGGDPAFFEEIRSQERIIWYRLEWSGFTGAAGDLSKRYVGYTTKFRDGDFRGVYSNLALMSPKYKYISGPGGRVGWAHYDLGHMPVPMNRTGTIKWVQRLEQEPPAW